MIKSTFFYLLPVILIFSCEHSSEPLSHQDIPYGTWVYSNSEDDVMVYTAANEFEQDNAGIAFRPSHVFIERSSGWCGTPPLTYANWQGSWQVLDQNNFKIICSNWMGEDYSRIMEIVSLNATELKIILH